MKLTLLLFLAVFGVAVAFPSEGDAPPAESPEAPVDSPPDDDDDEVPISGPTGTATDDDDEEGPSPEPTATATDDDDLHLNDIASAETPDAPAAVPEDDLDFDSLKKLVSDFSKHTNDGLETPELLKRISELESRLQRSASKVSREIEEETRKLGQIRFLLTQLGDLKNRISALQNNFRNIETGLSGSGPLPFSSMPLASGGGQHTAWATLYQGARHSGRTTILDFRGCSAFEECCKNLEDLDNQSRSIHTHGTCVTMYEGRDCQGESRDFYPDSPTNHLDFGNFNNRFSSGKACKLAVVYHD